jgi:hypothetical protein
MTTIHSFHAVDSPHLHLLLLRHCQLRFELALLFAGLPFVKLGLGRSLVRRRFFVIIVFRVGVVARLVVLVMDRGIIVIIFFFFVIIITIDVMVQGQIGRGGRRRHSLPNGLHDTGVEGNGTRCRHAAAAAAAGAVVMMRRRDGQDAFEPAVKLRPRRALTTFREQGHPHQGPGRFCGGGDGHRVGGGGTGGDVLGCCQHIAHGFRRHYGRRRNRRTLRADGVIIVVLGILAITTIPVTLAAAAVTAARDDLGRNQWCGSGGGAKAGGGDHSAGREAAIFTPLHVQIITTATPAVLVSFAKITFGHGDFAMTAITELDPGITAGKVRTNQLFAVLDVFGDDKVGRL